MGWIADVCMWCVWYELGTALLRYPHHGRLTLDTVIAGLVYPRYARRVIGCWAFVILHNYVVDGEKKGRTIWRTGVVR